MTASLTALAALNAVVPAAPMPALGPKWLDAGEIITQIVSWFGPWAIVGVMLVIFAETGLLVGFFLPGDSLLFTLGLFVATGDVGAHIWVAAPLMWLAAITGNQTGYLIGRKAGPRIFNRPNSRLFKQEYVERTSDFFERHGGKAVTLAQFVPIVRTFTPVMAGVGRMHYRHFVTFNVIGATLWAFGITWLGYFLGSIEWIQKNIDAMILVIVFVSVVPMILHALSGRRGKAGAGKPDAAPATGGARGSDGATEPSLAASTPATAAGAQSAPAGQAAPSPGPGH